MKAKWIASPCVAAALALSPATRAAADAGDAIAGAIVGGILGHVITKDQMKKKQQQQRQYTTQRRSTSGVSSVQREQNREVQVALNHFGYPVGAPDGVLGSQSRAAISQFQAFVGYPPTGQLTEYERTLLTTSYHRAIAGGAQVAQITATNPQGLRGLLLVQRDEMAGVAPAAPAAPGVAVGVAAGTMAAMPQVVAPAPAPALAPPVVAVAEPAPALPAPALPQLAAPAAPDAMAAAAPQPALPSFMGAGTAAPQVSLAAECNRVTVEANTGGGFVTVATMTDPQQALAQQFCVARAFAMTTGQEMTARVGGYTPEQIAQQCQAFGPMLKQEIAALPVKPRDEVLQMTTGVIAASGMAPAQLAGSAKICLGAGYSSDAMDVALGSALILTALGDRAYGELVGHHLDQGYGTLARPDMARDWYQAGLDAAAAGQGAFAPNMPERNDVIRKAVFAAGSKTEAPAVAPAAVPVQAVAPAPAPLPGAAPVQAAAEGTAAPVLDAGAAMATAARLPMLLMGQ